MLIVGACVVLIIAGVRASAPVLTTILLGLFLALIALPLQRFLRARGVGSLLASSLVIVGVVGVVGLLLWVLSVSLSQLSARLPVYQAGLARQFTAINELLVQLGVDPNWLANLNPPRLGSVLEVVVSVLGGIASSAWFMFLVFLVFSYTLVEAEGYAARFGRALGRGGEMYGRLRAYANILSTFIARQAVLGGAVAVCDMLLLIVLGIDFPVLWGLLSFLCSFIPNLGYYVALVPPMILAFIQYGTGAAVTVFLGYLVINTIFDNLIYPRYMGQGLNLSSLVTFLAVLFWGWVLGAVGALLSLPLTLLVKMLVLEAYPDSVWLATLISAEDTRDDAQARPAVP
jgi:predicted PurR-regulated permease PerM